MRPREGRAMAHDGCLGGSLPMPCHAMPCILHPSTSICECEDRSCMTTGESRRGQSITRHWALGIDSFVLRVGGRPVAMCPIKRDGYEYQVCWRSMDGGETGDQHRQLWRMGMGMGMSMNPACHRLHCSFYGVHMKRFEARLGRLGVGVSVSVSVTHDRDVRCAHP
jgi:hypothetical protein